jgi:hypothetical protein
MLTNDDLAYSPLNDSHLKQLNDALVAAKIARSQIAMAEAAGLDVAAQKAQLDTAEDQIRRIKSVYFPGR